MNVTKFSPQREDCERIVGQSSIKQSNPADPLDNLVLSAAVEAARLGYSVIAIDPRNKKPLGPWKHREHTAASPEDIAVEGDLRAFAIVTGAISGGVDEHGNRLFLTCLDFDLERFHGAWNQNAGSLAEGLSVQRTGNGLQVFFKSPVEFRNEKFAYAVNEDELTGREIAIESRGEGGYCLVSPSLHPSGRTYQWISGDLSSVPSISEAHARALVDAAQRLDEAPFTRQQLERQREREHKAVPAPRHHQLGAGVIEAYNAAHSIQEVLRDCGYKPNGDRFVRPGGKSPSVSVLDNCSFHHNSNDPLSDGHRHDAFSVYAFYKYNGDAKVAVREAAKLLGLPCVATAERTNPVSLLGARCADEATLSNNTTPQWDPPTTPSLVARELQGQLPALGAKTVRAQATEDEPSAPLFPRLKLREIFLRPNLEDLVEDFLRTCTTSVFGSEYGGYKSFIVLDIGLCVATGKRWQGRRVRQGRVVYIVGEGAYETKARVMAWMQVHGITEIPEDFEIIEIPVQIAGQYQQLIAELREFDPSLIIIDTLAQCNIGRDENDTAAMSELTHAVRMMSRELTAHVALVHHTGKNGLLRGNTSLPANLDTIIMLKKQPGRVVEIECDRTKGSPFEKFSLVGHVIELPERNEYGHNITSLVFERTDAPAPINQLSKTEQARESVFEALSCAPNGMTATEWQKKSGLSSSRFHDYRSELVNAGRVTLNGRIYTATPITPIYSDSCKSEPLLYSDYSDDPLGSEQSEPMAGVHHAGANKASNRRSKNSPDGEPYGFQVEEGDEL